MATIQIENYIEDGNLVLDYFTFANIEIKVGDE